MKKTAITITVLLSITYITIPAMAVTKTPFYKANPEVMTLKDITLEYMYVYGVELLGRGDHDEAARVFARILELDPYNEEAVEHLQKADPYNETLKKLDELRKKHGSKVKIAESIEKQTTEVVKIAKISENQPTITKSEEKTTKPKFNEDHLKYLDNEINTLKTKLAQNKPQPQQNDKIGKLTQILEENEKQISQLNQTIKTQEALLKTYKERTQNTHTIKKITQKETNIEDYRKLYNEAKAKLSTLEAVLNQKDQQLTSLKNQITKAKNEPVVESYSSHQINRDEIKIHGDETVRVNIDHYESLLTTKDSQITILKDKLADLNTTLEQYETLPSNITINDNFEGNFEVSKLDVDSVSDEYVQQQIASAKLDLHAEKQKYLAKTQELETLQAKFNDIQNRLALMQKSVNNKNQLIDNLQQDLNQLTQ